MVHHQINGKPVTIDATSSDEIFEYILDTKNIILELCSNITIVPEHSDTEL